MCRQPVLGSPLIKSKVFLALPGGSVSVWQAITHMLVQLNKCEKLRGLESISLQVKWNYFLRTQTPRHSQVAGKSVS